ncbi:MAG TPA: hypothetical protein PKV43_01430 [Armatimonadota bacterium]|nr:hypothetical protein [Armatimonadota bacterium]
MKTLSIFVLITVVLSSALVWAQEVLPVIPDITETEMESEWIAPEITEPEPPPPPSVTPDLLLFKRTPTIDGQIELGEWDTHFRFEYVEANVSTYVNWDNENLYIACRSSQPVDLLVILDCNNDGWFHGSDNYEFTARQARNNGSPTLSVSRYESQKSTGTVAAPLTAAEAAAFLMKAGSNPGAYVYEIAIPKSAAAGLELKQGRKIGLKLSVGFGDQYTTWIPVAMLGEVQTAELVAAKSSASSPLAISTNIRDSRLAPGEELVAKVTLKNNGDTIQTVDTLVIGGEGRTSKLLGSQLVRPGSIEPGKSFSTTFKTSIPKTALPGSEALGIEVRSDENVISTSLVSFDVLPPYAVTLEMDNAPAKPGEYCKVAVKIRNNTQKQLRGNVKLNLPEGWDLRWSDGTKQFLIPHEDGEQRIVFRVKVPEKWNGKAPILAEVDANSCMVSASEVVEVK